MKNRYIFMFILLVMLFSTCRNVEDDLDLIKNYKPQDKYFKSFMVSLHFIIETSSITRVDTVFTKIIRDYNLPLTAKGCRDGEYYGKSPFDAYDYQHIVKLKIKNGKIISVDYNEVNKDGRGKQEDDEYCADMSITGTTPAIAYPLMENRLLIEQDLMKVDAVSGATYSLYRFRYSVILVLIKARMAAY